MQLLHFQVAEFYSLFFTFVKVLIVMEERYTRNRLYITEEEQRYIKDFPILLGGAGIGSIIAECLLRFGFENLTIIDGDVVELSNLNRQNYTEKDISLPKVNALKERLLSINSNAAIKVHHCFLTPENVHEFIPGHKIAVNALDFTSAVPLVFDETCQKHSIPVLHPYNLGWGTLIFVISEELGLRYLSKEDTPFNELNVVEYATGYMAFWGNRQLWIENIIQKYKEENGSFPPPQLAIASWLSGAVSTHIAFEIAMGKTVKTFPEFYLTTIHH